MEPKIVRLIRHSHPTKFNEEPYRTQWLSLLNELDPVLYVQLSKNAASPQWHRISFLLEKAYEDYFLNEKFIDDLFKLYEKRIP